MQFSGGGGGMGWATADGASVNLFEKIFKKRKRNKSFCYYSYFIFWGIMYLVILIYLLVFSVCGALYDVFGS